MNKTVLYLIYFCVYSVALLLIGKSSLRDNRTVGSYFTCDRKVSLPLCICTFAGTWLSAITILSLTGGVYEDGLAVLFYSVVPWFLGGLLPAPVCLGRHYHSGNLPQALPVSQAADGLRYHFYYRLCVLPGHPV